MLAHTFIGSQLLWTQSRNGVLAYCVPGLAVTHIKMLSGQTIA